MEEQTLHYYIKLFSTLLIFFFIILTLYFFYFLNKKSNLISDSLIIKKGEKLEKIFNKNIRDISNLDIQLLKLYYFINNKLFNKIIHFGEFNINKDSSYLEIFKIIFNPSNVVYKLTIIEGWSQGELEKEFLKHFHNINTIHYGDIIADTYYFSLNNSFSHLENKLNKIKKQYFKDYKNHKILSIFSEDEIMVIGSLIEKEGLDYYDKKNISSVIFNRLSKNMKLQIDATVIYAITDGNYNLKRELLIKDLSINHPFNTYQIYGLPPKPISYVGRKTLDLIFENHKTDFLFYFFNNSLNRHIFSKTFEEHKLKLNDYRKNK